jgi:hypothetical protein
MAPLPNLHLHNQTINSISALPKIKSTPKSPDKTGVDLSIPNPASVLAAAVDRSPMPHQHPSREPLKRQTSQSKAKQKRKEN